MAERKAIKTPEFRGNYVSLAKPRAMKLADGTLGAASYQMLIPIPKKTKAGIAFMAELIALVSAAYLDFHGKPIVKSGKNYPIKDGDAELDEDGEPQFPGHWFFRVGSKFKPSVCDINGEPIDGELELYSGAWYRAKLTSYGWKHDTGGRGCSISLETVIKTRDDEKIGGGAGDAANDFADDIKKGGGTTSSLLD
jgi:hypothetical protein